MEVESIFLNKELDDVFDSKVNEHTQQVSKILFAVKDETFFDGIKPKSPATPPIKPIVVAYNQP